MRKIFILLSGCLLSLSVFAKNKTSTDSSQKCWLQFSQNQLMSIMQETQDRGQRIRLLQAQVNFWAQKVIRHLGGAKIEPLWISVGAIIDCRPMLQAKKIFSQKEFSFIESIRSMRRKAFLDEELKFEGIQPHGSVKYTYGLSKIKLPEVNQQLPSLNGLGRRVGIIDTGIDPLHPDLKGKTILFRDFIDPKNTKPRDDHGHGSHVAGTIAGGSASGTQIGVALSAELIVAKSFSKTGSSVDADLLRSLQWMADPDGNPQTNDQPDVISNSWNLDDVEYAQNEPRLEPFCVAIENLESLGTVVVFSAGNDGRTGGKIKLPGACPQALTVGATDSGDQVPSFSSRGPVWWKSQKFNKPDISAPGYNVNSAHIDGGYKTRSGTSMSVPHVAGALLILRQFSPASTVEELKEALLKGSTDIGKPGFDFDSGVGRLDLFKSIEILDLISK
jgi:hypothetical protein